MFRYAKLYWNKQTLLLLRQCCFFVMKYCLFWNRSISAEMQIWHVWQHVIEADCVKQKVGQTRAHTHSIWTLQEDCNTSLDLNAGRFHLFLSKWLVFCWVWLSMWAVGWGCLHPCWRARTVPSVCILYSSNPSFYSRTLNVLHVIALNDKTHVFEKNISDIKCAQHIRSFDSDVNESYDDMWFSEWVGC